jgi:hypothetical protein
MAQAPTLALDHLVVAASSLDQGLDWCDARFGIRPEAGGRHAAMGTHNRVFAIGSAHFARAYFEIIAIDPDAPRPAQARWFDLDDAALQARLAHGPRLVHWVARCTDIDATLATLHAAGVDCGAVQAAERATPHGLLRWRISVRADGRRPLAGAMPALIEWAGAHPTDTLPDSGVALQALRVAGWPAPLAAALLPSAIASDPRPGAPALHVELIGARGAVILES